MLDRSPGIHESGVLHDLCLIQGHYVEQEMDMSRLQLGCALEHAIILRYHQHSPQRYLVPGELALDSIYVTPDLADKPDRAVEEIKLTWLSAKHEIDSIKFWKHRCQLKAYCYVMGWPLGRLHICHINGNYSWLRNTNRAADSVVDGTSEKDGVVYNVWEEEFSESELRGNWQMIVDHAATMRSRGYKGECRQTSGDAT